MIPVSLLAWLGGEWLGVAASVLSALAWLVDDLASSQVHLNYLAACWNVATRLGFFLVASWSLSALRKTLRREQALARTDPMTGAINKRFFYDLAQMEINRLAAQLFHNALDDGQAQAVPVDAHPVELCGLNGAAGWSAVRPFPLSRTQKRTWPF